MRLLALISLLMLRAAYEGFAQKPATGAKPKVTQKPIVLTGRCAVIVRPDNRKIALMKQQNSDDGYTASVNDNEYYMGISGVFLDSATVKQIAKPARGIVVFKSVTGHYFKISLSSLYWGIILFNGQKKPIEADITDIETGYRAYMRK